MRHHAQRVLLLALLAPAGCACTGASKAHSLESRPAPTAPDDGTIRIPDDSRPFVTVEAVSARTNAAVLRAPARVAFRDGAVSRLNAPLSGRVQRVHVRTGDRVEVGDPLITLDCPEAATIRAALSTARASRHEAAAALERHERMLERGVGTERERLEAERRFAEAEAELARAQAGRRFVGTGPGTTVVLRAPLSGTVVSRSATVGAAVEVGGEPLVEIGDPTELWVVADVFERDLHLIREGMRATVELPSVSEPLVGHVLSIGAVVEGSARTAPVRLALEGPGGSLRPGMFGRARIESPDEALSLPVAAVLVKGPRSFVFVQSDEGSFTRRDVIVGHPVEGRVLVRAGVAPGERVVVGGALLLDGAADQML